jgi:hypothetical protein
MLTKQASLVLYLILELFKTLFMRQKNIAFIKRETIAVIGEGITEREYFKSLKQHEKFPFKFKPEIPKHSDIRSILIKAESLANSFDLVYCIIDLDRILLNSKELEFYNKNKSKIKNIIIIENNPCFEIWFLLHFELSTRAYENCPSLITLLKKHIPDYNKSFNYLYNKDLYWILKPKLEYALKNSVRLGKLNRNCNCDVHKLLLSLMKDSLNSKM